MDTWNYTKRISNDTTKMSIEHVQVWDTFEYARPYIKTQHSRQKCAGVLIAVIALMILLFSIM